MTVFTLSQASAAALGGMTVRARTTPYTLGPAPRGAVRRDSIEAGTFEAAFFVAPAKGETDHLLRIARRESTGTSSNFPLPPSMS